MAEPRTLAADSGVEDAYPLAPMQSEMLVHSLSAPGSGAYVQQAICDLRERLQPAQLEHAWRTIVARHAILRTSFRIDRDPVQEVRSHAAISWAHLDWRGGPPAEQESRFDAFLDADRQREFALDSPPMRFALLQLADAHYRLLWTYHHALLDGRSIRIVLRELFDLYDARLAGRDLALPAARAYRGYIDWLGRQDAAAAESFWRAALEGFAAPTRLPVERPRSQRGKDDGRDEGSATAELTLGRESTDALRRIAREQGLTLNTLLLGAWAQLLSRYSGETDVIFDTTLALRGDRRDESQDIVGLCINTVPMRLRVEPEMALAPWLDGLRAQWLAMRPHAWLPLAAIHRGGRGSRAERAMSTLVVFEHATLDALLHEDRGWSTRSFARRSTPGHPLTLACFGGPELALKIAYARSHYDAATIAAMLEHLRNLLESAIDGLHRPIREQQMLSPSERRRIVVEWNDTARDYPADCGVHELFERQAARTPEALAVESTAGSLSYRELDGRANQLARYLRGRAVEREALVALCLPRTPELVAALLGILKAGCAYLPLDPGHPPERLEGILRDAAVSCAITTQALSARLGEARATTILLDAEREAIARETAARLDVRVGAQQLAYVVYTSGSTGRPKGIEVPHGALTNHTLALAEHYAVSPRDRRLQFVSLSADVLIADLFPVLVSGGAAVLRPDSQLISIAQFLRFVASRRVTITGIPSAYWHEWVETMTAPGAAPLPDSLRVVVSGMDTVRPEAFAAWRARVGRRVRWCNAYGPSEATCTATIFDAETAGDRPLATVPIGRPIANVRIHVLDPYGHPVPVGVPGEICIAGRGVALGYRNRPDLTALSFVRDPFSDRPGDRLYRTGDLGRYLPDGNVEFLGRADSQIKIRGYRVEPAEVESALRALPQVRDAAVVGHGAAGEARRLIAYVVADGSDLGTDQLRRQLRRSLPDYMVPAAIVTLASLPRAANGKIDYAALPVPEAPERRAGGYVAPRDALERELADIWQELLRIPRIGIGDHFFDLGGDSLLAMRMLGTVGSARHLEVPLELFLAHATIEGLADALRLASTSPGASAPYAAAR
ncbi:MAG TPA: amino acid adenylation domain-containing protein [Casimicrobiaceae bacterium]|nr:amino acid adenylation domain-containing protein [Casimicrobiaceae bacterium]